MEALNFEEEVPFEYQVFGLALTEPGAISYFYENLPPEMVGALTGHTGLHEFYQAVLQFHDKTGLDPIDPIALTSWLDTETEICDSLGGPGGVKVFIDIVTSMELSNPESVTKVLRYRATERKKMDALQELQRVISKKAQKTEEDKEAISYLTEQIRTLENDLDYDPFSDVTTASDISSRIDDLMEVPDFLPTQFKALNRAMGYTDKGGFFRGAVHAVVAQSGKGKSTFAKTLCNHWLDEGNTVLFINFEEAQAHWERILFTQTIKQNVYQHAEKWTDIEKEHNKAVFKERLDRWGDRLLVRHHPDSSYFDDLERWLRDIIGHNDIIPDVVVIDTIQSLLSKKGGPRWEGYENMMIRLERLAKDMGAVFILTAQQNTMQAKEKRELVEQHDMGGSIAIIQKCSVSLFITPKKMSGGDESDSDFLMEIQIPKSRITGANPVYNPPLVMYNDETKSYEDYEELEDLDIYNKEFVEADDIFGEDFFS